MDTANIAVILSSATTIAAIVVPAITTVFTIRSNEKMKHLELHSPKVYDAVNHMTSAYSEFIRSYELMFYNEQNESAMREQASQLYRNFFASCYEVMALINNDQIHSMILALLLDLENYIGVNPQHNVAFHEITAAIAKELSGKKSKRQKGKHGKSQGSQSH